MNPRQREYSLRAEKKSIWFILLFLMGLVCGFAPPSFSQQTLEINGHFTNAQVFFLSDFDILNLGNSPLIFQITIENTSGDSTHVTLMFQLIAQRYQDSGPLIKAKTKPFWLKPHETRTINNRDLTSAASRYTDIEAEYFDYNEDAARELQNAILATGKLPDDTYIFRLILEEEGNSDNSAVLEEELTITNVTTLDLISPGENSGGGELMELFTTYPLFQWESNAHFFRLTVCEKIQPEASPEEVMDGEPRLTVYIQTDPTQDPPSGLVPDFTTNSNSFQYPSSDVWPLEEGKTYYWQVVAITQSSSGPIELESEIWGFKVRNLSSDGSNAEQMQLLSYLRMLLGNDVVDALFGQTGELSGYTTTGVILNNGSMVSIDVLNTLIEQFLTGQVTISSFTVE